MPVSADITNFEAALAPDSVLTCADLDATELTVLAQKLGAEIAWLAAGDTIRGSYWGDREAGLIGNRLYIRGDTPVHSALHELCHYVCMPPNTRQSLHTNAGGDYDEENGVCYLQSLLAAWLPSCGVARMHQDMDAWGYTFRLGSAQAWFEHDAQDARQWLLHYQLIDADDVPTWNLRERA